MFRSLFSLFEARWSPSEASLRRTPQERNDSSVGNEAHQIVDESLREMESVIERLTTAKVKAQAERNEAVAMLQSYKTAHENIRTRAKSLIQSGQAEAARAMIEEQQSLETVIASFERIVRNMSAAVQKLTTQLDAMRIQREEVKAQRTVLAAQLASAQSREEFLENLRQSGASRDLLEREAIHAELRLASGDVHSSDLQDFRSLSADAALKALEQQIENEFATERAEKERVHNEASLKRFQLAFANVNQHTSPLKTGTKSGISEENEVKRRMMETFFTAPRTTDTSASASERTPAVPNAPQEKSASNTQDKIVHFFSQHPPQNPT